MATVQDLVTQAKNEGGLDVTDAQALAWFNERHREMMGYARKGTAGNAAATFAAELPADATLASNVTTLQVDADIYPALVAGVIATGLLRIEQRPDVAEAHENKFRDGAERMRERVKQRYLTQTTDSVQALLNEAASVDGVDATQAQLLLRLNRRHRSMVAAAKSFRDVVDVGPTVVGQAFYAVSDVVETYAVEVNGVPYSKARRPDVYSYSQGTLLWVGDGGFVVEDANSSNVQGFTLIPTPDEAGLSINVWAAVMPPTLVAADAIAAVKVDSDCYDGLIAGVVADGFMFSARPPRPDVAASYEEVFAATVEKLRRRVKRRYNTSGPATIRIVGTNA